MSFVLIHIGNKTKGATGTGCPPFKFMGGRSIKDNFKRRLGDPARIEVEYETGKISSSEQSYQNEKVAEAYIDVLRHFLGRAPTHAEIIGKVDISKPSTRGCLVSELPNCLT